MTDAGRIRSTLHSDARAIVFDADLSRAASEELPHYAAIDRAQAVMLVKAGLMDGDLARRLLCELDRMEADAFRGLARLPTPRGVYLAYEDHLRNTVGEAAGNLHLGRSRNDINATVLKLKLRQPFKELVLEIVTALDVLCDIGDETLETVFPLHTHRQPAVPSTLAHHMAGFAEALVRDLEAVLAVAPILDMSPLGAGVGGGTTVPIQTELTARLLGFSSVSENSIDSVASRDLVLRLLAALAILCSNLGRIAETMLLWLGDSGLAALPDELVGSSSAMPHKRNAFLLEHVQGKAGSVTGCLMAAMTGTHAAPFTNCVAVGTEATRHIWGAVRETIDAVRLTRLCVRGLTVNEDATATLLNRSFVDAMEAATRLAVSGELDFRTAHLVVGGLVNAAIATSACRIADTAGAQQFATLTASPDVLEPGAIVRAARFGGGPSPAVVAASLSRLRRVAADSIATLNGLDRTWRRGANNLRTAADRILGGLPPFAASNTDDHVLEGDEQ